MPMIVNSKLTHYKIRQISTETKRFKNTQTAKMEYIVTDALLSIIVHVSIVYMTSIFLPITLLCRFGYLFNKLCLHNLPPPPVILTFDLLTLKVVPKSRVTWASVPICLPRPLCSRLRPNVRDRHQTDRRQTASLLNAPA